MVRIKPNHAVSDSLRNGLRTHGAFVCCCSCNNYFDQNDSAVNAVLSSLSKNETSKKGKILCVLSGSDLAGGRPGDQLKLGLTMINNARQLSRSLERIHH